MFVSDGRIAGGRLPRRQFPRKQCASRQNGRHAGQSFNREIYWACCPFSGGLHGRQGAGWPRGPSWSRPALVEEIRTLLIVDAVLSEPQHALMIKGLGDRELALQLGLGRLAGR